MAPFLSHAVPDPKLKPDRQYGFPRGVLAVESRDLTVAIEDWTSGGRTEQPRIVAEKVPCHLVRHFDPSLMSQFSRWKT